MGCDGLELYVVARKKIIKICSAINSDKNENLFKFPEIFLPVFLSCDILDLARYTNKEKRVVPDVCQTMGPGRELRP